MSRVGDVQLALGRRSLAVSSATPPPRSPSDAFPVPEGFTLQFAQQRRQYYDPGSERMASQATKSQQTWQILDTGPSLTANPTGPPGPPRSQMDTAG